MTQLLASVLCFAFGLLFLPMVFRGMRINGTRGALKTGLVTGVLSVGLGKVLFVLLSFIFLPILLLGAVGVFLVQMVVNIVLVQLASRLGTGIEFDSIKTAFAAAVALTVLQTMVGYAV